LLTPFRLLLRPAVAAIRRFLRRANKAFLAAATSYRRQAVSCVARSAPAAAEHHARADGKSAMPRIPLLAFLGEAGRAKVICVLKAMAIGALVLYAAETGFFDDEEMKLLVELAGDISFALDHIEKEEKVRRLTRVHAVLTGINAAIVRIRDREELFRESCRIAFEAGQLRLAWIGIVDPRREEVVPAAFSGAEQGLLGIIQLSTREDSGRFGMAGRAIRDRAPAVSHDLLADKRIRYSKEQEERGFRSLAMIPLIVHGAAIGVLGLHVAEAGFFNQDEMKLLTEVAGNISFALEHIDKEEKVRRLTRVHAVLSGINAAIVRTRDRQGLFDDACRFVPKHDRKRIAQRSLDHFQIGMTKPGRTNPHQHVGRLQARCGNGFDRQRRLRRMQYCGAILERHLDSTLSASAVRARSRSADVISHSFPKFATMARMKGSTMTFATASSPR